MTKNNIKHSFLKILTGSELSLRQLAMMQAKGTKPGPVIWLTGCIHGEEVGGIVIIQEIFKRLKTNPLTGGSLYAFPLINQIGFETMNKNIGFSGEDLNRSFPGDAKGTVAERMAYKIFNTIKKTRPTLVLDLHNDWIKSIPHVLIDSHPGKIHQKAYNQALDFSRKTGLIVVDEEKESNKSELKKTLSGSLLAQNISALTLEMGGSFTVEEDNVTKGVRAIENILISLKMIEPNKKTSLGPDSQKSNKKVFHYAEQQVNSANGVIRFLVQPGETVKKGQVLAKIYNIFGAPQETLYCHKNGVVLGYADSSVALPGTVVMSFAV